MCIRDRYFQRRGNLPEELRGYDLTCNLHFGTEFTTLKNLEKIPESILRSLDKYNIEVNSLPGWKISFEYTYCKELSAVLKAENAINMPVEAKIVKESPKEDFGIRRRALSDDNMCESKEGTSNTNIKIDRGSFPQQPGMINSTSPFCNSHAPEAHPTPMSETFMSKSPPFETQGFFARTGSHELAKELIRGDSGNLRKDNPFKLVIEDEDPSTGLPTVGRLAPIKESKNEAYELFSPMMEEFALAGFESEDDDKSLVIKEKVTALRSMMASLDPETLGLPVGDVICRLFDFASKLN
eukprot:TRINITY_DN6136_c0_g1_i4.p1 TRINITY_DN6136_c0_g1~~TRINITY_DN6136_c0_g1_i4.p1  ORF type:complete len:317 (+),score=80.46 TRINITY_DN6136_c0_g1_i4:61-951(+)